MNRTVTRYREVEPYITKDGSVIRELMHPQHHNARQQSLAEAIVPANSETQRHRHLASEEIYHVTRGKGLMLLGDQPIEISIGDTIAIPPGTPHKLINPNTEALHVLCACSPAYSHDDTELMEELA